MNVHVLKTWPEPWQAQADGLKTFELRPDDRGYEVGDILILRLWDPRAGDGGAFLGGVIGRKVSWLTRGPFVRDGYVAMATMPLTEDGWRIAACDLAERLPAEKRR